MRQLLQDTQQHMEEVNAYIEKGIVAYGEEHRQVRNSAGFQENASGSAVRKGEIIGIDFPAK